MASRPGWNRGRCRPAARAAPPNPFQQIEHAFDTGPMAGGSGRGHKHPIPLPPPARRHCWVNGTTDAPGPHPGLVLAWEKRDDGWWALVAYFIEGDGVLVQQWLRGELLTPVGLS